MTLKRFRRQHLRLFSTRGHQTLSKASKMSKSSATMYRCSEASTVHRSSTIASSVDIPGVNPNRPGANDVQFKHDLTSFSNNFPCTRAMSSAELRQENYLEVRIRTAAVAYGCERTAATPTSDTKPRTVSLTRVLLLQQGYRDASRQELSHLPGDHS